MFAINTLLPASARINRRHWLVILILVAMLGQIVTVSRAADQAKKDEIPEPEDIALDTKDGVFLKCTYYKGTNGKTTVPIIILHDAKGQRSDFNELALGLQANGGHAVLVPDLRGHGESTKYRKLNGEVGEIEPAKLKSADYGNMVLDVQACKNFLRDKNNEGDVNIEQLCLIGIGPMGSVTAFNFALVDWSRQELIGYKLGQDVKAFVLVSPAVTFQGNSMGAAMSHPMIGYRLSTMLIGGKRDKEAMTPIIRKLEAQHVKPPKDPAEKEKYQDLFIVNVDAEVKGTKLLDPKMDLGLENKILKFIELRLVDKQEEMPWAERKSPGK